MLPKRRRLAVLPALLLGAGLAVAAPAPAALAHENNAKVVTAYFADWDVYGRGYFVKDIPADNINVIQYAFGVPTFDKTTGAVGCNVLDPWADFQMVYWSGANS